MSDGRSCSSASATASSPIERDAWLRCMHTAVASIDSGTLDDEHRRELLAYLEMAADSMVNSPF